MNRESLPAGTILIIENEQYTIEKTIGWGGSALVYAAKKNDSSVVIKELYPQGCLRKNGQIVSEKNTIAEMEDLQKKFGKSYSLSVGMAQNNYQILNTAFQTENAIICGNEDIIVNNYYAVMDNLSTKGITLYDYIQEIPKNDSKRSLADILNVMNTILDAYAKLHHRFVHGDCKPGNLFLLGEDEDKSKTCYIFDFTTGCELNTNGKTDPIKDEKFFATDGYMAPEFLMEDNKSSFCLKPSYDVWALGRIFLELLRGCILDDDISDTMSMYKKDKAAKTIDRVMEELFWKEDDSDRIGESAAIKAYINQILMKAMDNDPEQRYQNAREMQDDLQLLRRCLDLDLGQNSEINDFFLWEASRRYCQRNPGLFLTEHKPTLVAAEDFPVKKLTIFGTVNGEDKEPVKDILSKLEKQHRKEQCDGNVYLHGAGGSGKSFAVSELVKGYMESGKRIPLYLDLGTIPEECLQCNYDDVLPMMIAEQYLFLGNLIDENVRIKICKQIKELLNDSGSKEYCLVLDNLHKVKKADYDKVLSGINTLSKYNNTWLVAAGRKKEPLESSINLPAGEFKEKRNFNLNNRIALAKLSDKEILACLNKVYSFTAKQEKTITKQKNTLGIPMFLMRYMEVVMQQKDSLELPNSTANVLQYYFDSVEAQNDSDSSRLTGEILNNIMPQFAYSLSRDGVNEIKKETILEEIKSSVSNPRIYRNGDDLLNHCIEKLVILEYIENNKLRFVHDCYQEYFASVFIADKLSMLIYREDLDAVQEINHEWPIEYSGIWGELLENTIEKPSKKERRKKVLDDMYAIMSRYVKEKCINKIPYNIGCWTADINWHQLGAKMGHAHAQVVLAEHYFEGDGVSKDKQKAVFYCKAAAHELASAKHFLAICYLCGEGVSQNVKEAIILLEKAADAGDLYAKTNLATCYLHGWGVTVDKEKALKLYQELAENGIETAQQQLASCYYEGNGVLVDKEKAVYWYQKAAKQGLDVAQNDLACCLSKGEGIDENHEEAVYWYKEAAINGFNKAQYNLACCLFKGEGIAKNKEEALKWLKKAANNQYAEAQYNLAYFLFEGVGIEKNKKEAVQWYQRAAENKKQPNAKAQYQLAMCYLLGDGIAKNIKKARYWFEKAAGQRHTGAINMLNLLNEK